MSHARRRAGVRAWPVLAISIAGLASACTGEGKEPSRENPGQAQPGSPPDGGFKPSIAPQDLIEPLVGERRLAPDAIEVDPMALMPAGLPITDEDRALVAELLRSLQPLDHKMR